MQVGDHETWNSEAVSGRQSEVVLFSGAVTSIAAAAFAIREA